MNKGIINYIIIIFVLIITSVLLYKIITYEVTPVEKIINTSTQNLTTPLPGVAPDPHLDSDDIRDPQKFVCVGEFCDGSGEADSPSEKTTTTVHIPLVKEGGTFGCGVDIFYTAQAVPKTTSVLDASYRLLFDLKKDPEIKEDGFWNTVAEYAQLHYDRVTITDRIARVYLLGKMYGPGHCSLPEIREQITQTALYYPNISKVEVYLNGGIYDWCEQDQSDGEGPCPETPDYWVKTK